jgi:hypothetical protein
MVMRHKLLRQKSGTRTPRRLRSASSANTQQYSLFVPMPPAPSADAGYFERQARLCERLLSGLHQPELVALLGKLHAEFEAKAALVEEFPGTTD